MLLYVCLRIHAYLYENGLPFSYFYKEGKMKVKTNQEIKEGDTVFINSFYDKECDSYVVMDDVKSGELVTNHLISQGHNKIGGIFKSDDIQGIKRYEGLIKTLKSKNIALNDNSIIWYTTEDFKYLFT